MMVNLVIQISGRDSCLVIQEETGYNCLDCNTTNDSSTCMSSSSIILQFCYYLSYSTHCSSLHCDILSSEMSGIENVVNFTTSAEESQHSATTAPF